MPRGSWYPVVTSRIRKRTVYLPDPSEPSESGALLAAQQIWPEAARVELAGSEKFSVYGPPPRD